MSIVAHAVTMIHRFVNTHKSQGKVIRIQVFTPKYKPNNYMHNSRTITT